MKKPAAVAVLFIVTSLALLACGGAGGSSSTTGGSQTPTTGGGGSTIHFEANPDNHLMFTTMKATGKAGDDTIVFKNLSSTPHNLAIEDSSGKKLAETKTLDEGETSVKVELEPGTYTFFCSIPGHREGGMEGTLTIE